MFPKRRQSARWEGENSFEIGGGVCDIKWRGGDDVTASPTAMHLSGATERETLTRINL